MSEMIYKDKLILGVTGGIGSGKSTVLDLLKKEGIPGISSDDLAHRAIERGTPAYQAILKRYGRIILTSNREISRSKLGQIVFKSPQERSWLEKRIHPEVIKQLKRFIRDHHGLMVLDIPLLFERKLQSLVDAVLVVYAPEQVRIVRLLKNRRLTRTDILARMAAQLSLSEKRRRADVVLDNSSTPSVLKHRVRRLVGRLKMKNLKNLKNP